MTADFNQFFHAEAADQVRRASLLLGSVEDANDVVQEALTRVYERWGRLDDPGPYLNRTVLNLCRDRARRRDRYNRLLPRLTADHRDGGDNEILDDVLAGPPFNHRAVLVLRYWGGLSVEEIASELSCPPGSVGPWMNRG